MSKLYLKYGLLALAMTSLLACQKFSKNFQENAFICGIEPDQYEHHAQLLQIVDDQNQRLGPERLQSLQVELRQDGLWTPLKISRGGCVIVDRSLSAAIVAQDPAKDEAAYMHLDQLETDFIRVSLHKRRAFSMRFTCPLAAYAADEKLELNAFYAGDGAAEAGLWLAFTAQKWNPETSTPANEPALLLRDEALARHAFPQSLSIQALPEGTYKLTARAGYLKPGQSMDNLEVLGNPDGCLLQVMRQTPEPPRWKLAITDRPDSDPPELILPVRQPLDLIKAPAVKLEYCIEPLQKPLNRCEPQQSCLGSAAVFAEADTISINKAGQWAVFVRSRDAARHTSPLTCASVQASETAPSFSVQWSEQEWNQPFPLLSLPPVTVEANVTDLKHEVVGKNYLVDSLECRVTVASSLGNLRGSHYSRCLTGRCAGLALKDWQPCSTSITVDLSQEWLRSENWEGSIALHVRASDQAGHSHTVQKNLWFSGQRLQNKQVKHPVSGDPIWSSQILQRRDGLVFASAEGQLLHPNSKGFQADTSVSSMIGQRPVSQMNLFEDQDGVALWGFWTFRDEEAAVLGKRVADKWLFQPTTDQGAPAQSCQAFGQNHQGRLLCLDQTSLSVMNQEHRWLKIPLRNASGPIIPCDLRTPLSNRYTESKQGRWLICNRQTLLFQSFDQEYWQEVPVSAQTPSIFQAVFVDRHSELWILGNQGSTTTQVFALKDEVWEDRSQGFDAPWYIREEDNPIRDLENFHELANGSLRFGVQLYDAALRSWRSMLPDHLQSYEGVAQDGNGDLWTVVDGKALLRFYPNPLILPLEILGLQPGSRLVSIARDDSSIWTSFVQTGNIVYRGSAGLYQLDILPWQSLSFGFIRTPAYGEAWNEWIKDHNGQKLLQREDGEIVRLDPDAGWTVVSLPSDRPPDLKKSVALILQGKNFLAQMQWGLVWIWDRIGFKEFPLTSPDGVLHDLRFAKVDGRGQIWSSEQSWDEPLRIYRLNEQLWEPYVIKDLPKQCSGPLVFFESDKLLLSCDKLGPVMVHGQTLTFLADAYPEIDWDDRNLQHWTIPVSDTEAPYVFFTSYHYEKREQILYRYETKTGQKKQWRLIDDRRLHIRGDMMTAQVYFESIVLDPGTPDRFLIPSSKFILRPEGNTLKVAVNGNSLILARGLDLAVNSGLIRDLDIQRYGEVWILIRELGLVRYDSIWQAEEKDESPETEP